MAHLPHSSGKCQLFSRIVSQHYTGPGCISVDEDRGDEDGMGLVLRYRKSYYNCWDTLLSNAESRRKGLQANAVQKAICDDVKAVVSFLKQIMGNKTEYKRYFQTTHEHSQLLLDLLDELLQSCAVDIPRSKFTKALLHLSSVSGLHPECLRLPSVVRVGKDAVSGGSFADVWKGKIGETMVALKVVRLFDDSDKTSAIKKFLREAIIWNQFRHPNVLPFFGLYYLDERICFVSPWMENGDLKRYMKRNGSVRPIMLAHDISHGVAFLHENNIVHGDLKGENILITPEGRACIADFGLSNVIATHANQWTSFRTNTVQGGTVRWQAPELFKGFCTTYETDIYALGSVFYEVFSGKHPFSDCPQDAAVMLKVLGGDRPSRPSGLTESMWRLMGLCWLENAKARPSTNQIVEAIHSEGDSDCPSPDWDNYGRGELGRAIRKYPLVPRVDEVHAILSSSVNQTMRMDLAQQQQIRRQAGSPADLFSAHAPDAFRRSPPTPPGLSPSMPPPVLSMQRHLPRSPAQQFQLPMQQPAHLEQKHFYTLQATSDKLYEHQNKAVVLKASIEHEQKQLDSHRVQNRDHPHWTNIEQRHIQPHAAKNQMLPKSVDGFRGMAQQLYMPFPQNMGGHLSNAPGQRPAPAQGWMGQGGTSSNPAQMQSKPGLSANHFPYRQPGPAHLPNQGVLQNGPSRTGPTYVQQPGQPPQIQNRPTPFAAQMQQFAQNGEQSAPGPSSAPQQPGQPFSNMRIAPLERDRFENSFKNFCNSNILKLDPTIINIDNRQVDLYALHSEVMKEGGEANVVTNGSWSFIGARMGFVHFPGSHQCPSSIANQLQHAYTMYLSKFDGLYISSYLKRAVNRDLVSPALNLANNNTPPNNALKPMPDIEMLPSPGQINESSPFIQPELMSDIVTHAHQSAAALRTIFHGEEEIVQFIENNRAQLIQRQQEQGNFQLAVRAQPQNGQVFQRPQSLLQVQPVIQPSWDMQVGGDSDKPPSAPQFTDIDETWVIPSPPPEAQRTIDGKPGLPPQLPPDHPLIKQHIQILVDAAPKVRSQYQSKLIAAPLREVLTEQQPQFRAILNHLLKLVHDFELETEAYSYIYMNNMAKWNKVITMTVLVRHQDHLLRSPYPRYVTGLDQLTLLLQDLSAISKQFKTLMNTVSQSQQDTEHQILFSREQSSLQSPNPAQSLQRIGKRPREELTSEGDGTSEADYVPTKRARATASPIESDDSDGYSSDEEVNLVLGYTRARSKSI